MKVSKIILASLLGAVAINSVMADEYDGPRNRCKAQSDKVWIEETKYCASVNPCTVKKSNENEEQYCIRDFKEVEVSHPVKAVVLAEQYFEIIGGYGQGEYADCFYSGQTGKETSLLGQNYIACTTSHGGYFVFEFDDTSNSEFFNEGERERLKVLNAFCGAAGGQLMGDFDSGAICKGVTSRDTCKDFERIINNLINDDNKEVDKVKSFVGATGCEIRRDRSHWNDTFSDKIKQVLK